MDALKHLVLRKGVINWMTVTTTAAPISNERLATSGMITKIHEQMAVSQEVWMTMPVSKKLCESVAKPEFKKR